MASDGYMQSILMHFEEFKHAVYKDGSPMGHHSDWLQLEKISISQSFVLPEWHQT